MAVASSSFSGIDDVTITSLLFYILASFLILLTIFKYFLLNVYFQGNLDSGNDSANASDIRSRHCVNQVMPRSWRC